MTATTTIAAPAIYGVKRDGDAYFIQVPGPADGRHDNIRPLWWQPSTQTVAVASLLEAQLSGLDSPIERESKQQWTASFTRPVVIGKKPAFKSAGRNYGTGEPYMAGNPRNGY